MLKLFRKIQRFFAIKKAMRELEKYQLFVKEKKEKGETITYKAGCLGEFDLY